MDDLLDQDLVSGGFAAGITGGFKAGIIGSFSSGVTGFLNITDVINFFSELIRSKSSPFIDFFFGYACGI